MYHINPAQIDCSGFITTQRIYIVSISPIWEDVYCTIYSSTLNWYYLLFPRHALHYFPGTRCSFPGTRFDIINLTSFFITSNCNASTIRLALYATQCMRYIVQRTSYIIQCMIYNVHVLDAPVIMWTVDTFRDIVTYVWSRLRH